MRNQLLAFCCGLGAATCLSPVMADVSAHGSQSSVKHSASSHERTPNEAKGSPIEGGAVLMDTAAGASREQLNAQYEALGQIEDLRVTYDSRGIPRDLFGQTPYDIPKDITNAVGRAALDDVLEQIRTILLAEGTETLTLAREPHVQLHLRDIAFVESIRGIPVSDSKLVLTVDDRTGKVVMITATFLPDRGLP